MLVPLIGNFFVDLLCGARVVTVVASQSASLLVLYSLPDIPGSEASDALRVGMPTNASTKTQINAA